MNFNSDDEIAKIIKNKDIFFIFEDFNIEFGGLSNAVFKRANYLANQGYSITLLNLDPIKNFQYILDKFYNDEVLSEKVKFFNPYDYYSKKNCSSNNYKLTNFDEINSNNELFTEIIENDDNSVTVNYFKDDSFESLIKSELYIENILIYRKILKPRKQEFFTKDGFKYLKITRKKRKEIFTLYDKEKDNSIKFKGINNFLYHFMDEICSKTFKPFLLCDSTSHRYNMNGVKTDAYKIGVMHGNPYVLDNEPIDYISPKINHLSHLDDLEVVVLLTNEVKYDIVKELKQDKFVVIPNFIPDENLETELVPKELNKIRIFSRISSEKQISDAINAFNIVLDSKPDAILEIYGRALTDNEKSELSKLKKLITELNLENNVLFKGHIDDVNEEMQKSLCTLIISKHEGLPLALLESMANATPVICYNFKYSPKDVITDGVDGIIVEKGNINQLANEMINLLNNPQKAIELGLNARERIKNNFSTSSTGYKWEELLRNVFIKTTLNDLNNMSGEIMALKKENKKLKKINKSMANSKSWKLTKPLRKLFNLFKK